MKILWLRPSKGDNISVRRERIASHLRDRGFEITIRDASGLDAIGATYEALTGKYDIIAGNVRMGLFIGYPLARILRKPVLGDVSDPITDIEYLPEPFYRFFGWLEWKLLKRADAAVFVYESSYQEAIERGITDAVKLPNVVDHDLFENPDPSVVRESQRILQSISIDLDKPIAIYIGGFSDNYCINEIVEAATKAPDWQFVFIGEGELKQTVSNASEDIENVYYPGAFRYELMPGFLSHADVGFCFKNAEQPLKLKEYGAAGIPTIVQFGELERWYDKDELVFIEPRSEDIVTALDQLKKPSNRESYAKQFKSSMETRNWANIADEYEQLFKEF